MRNDQPIRVLIASSLEPEYVDQIARVDPRVEVLYEPDILPVPRYVADHYAPKRELTEAQMDRWRTLLAAADVSFDFDWWAPADMPQNCPNLRWVQATSSGIGQFVQRTHLDQSGITFTTAAGAHAIPLAEFAVMSVLHFIKDVPELDRRRHAHYWARYTGRQLAGQTVTVVGLGHVGRRTVEVFAALGCEVRAVSRWIEASGAPGAREVVTPEGLDRMLRDTSILILCSPLTPETRGMIDERRLRLLPRGAIIVNIARGPLIDEGALIGALMNGHLGGAGLDVFATEPLPTDSPLWDMDNVIVSPHSASTVYQENAVLTDLFCDNLRLLMEGAPLRNVYDSSRGY